MFLDNEHFTKRTECTKESGPEEEDEGIMGGPPGVQPDTRKVCVVHPGGRGGTRRCRVPQISVSEIYIPLLTAPNP